jgi:hypothetical protein
MTRVTLAVVVGGGLLVFWSAAPAAPTPTSVPASLAELAAIDRDAPIVQEINEEAARMREQLAHPPPFQPPQRDPFDFGTPRPTPSPAKSSAQPESPAVAKEILPPVVMPLHLVAVLVTTTDGGPVRTAAIDVDDDVHIVKVGQVLAGFTVRSIGPDSVEVIGASGSPIVIR